MGLYEKFSGKFDNHYQELEEIIAKNAGLCLDNVVGPQHEMTSNIKFNIAVPEDITLFPGDEFIIQTGFLLPDIIDYNLELKKSNTISKHPLSIDFIVNNSSNDEIEIIIANTASRKSWNDWSLCGYKPCYLSHNNTHEPHVYNLFQGEIVGYLNLSIIVAATTIKMSDYKRLRKK